MSETTQENNRFDQYDGIFYNVWIHTEGFGSSKVLESVSYCDARAYAASYFRTISKKSAVISTHKDFMWEITSNDSERVKVFEICAIAGSTQDTTEDWIDLADDYTQEQYEGD